MRFSFFPFIVLFAYCLSASAQGEILGEVVDRETGEPVPFANLGVPAKAAGTVSDDKGRYRLAGVSAADEIAVSAIGYETARVHAKDLREQPRILLQPRDYTFRSIVVEASRFGEDKVLGRKFEHREQSIGFTGELLGAEIGALIPIEAETLLKSAHFTIDHAKGDSVLLRINLYLVRDGLPGEQLLPENLLLVAGLKRGTVEVNLSSYQLVVDGDIFLALEWVKDLSGAGIAGVTFRQKKAGKKNANAFARLTSHSTYMPLNIALGFFLVGKQAN